MTIDLLKKVINEIKESKNEKLIVSLEDEMTLRDDLGLNSLDLAELTVKIEDETGVDIFEDGLVNKVVEILKKLEIK